MSPLALLLSGAACCVFGLVSGEYASQKEPALTASFLKERTRGD